jgi:hypothetical protein
MPGRCIAPQSRKTLVGFRVPLRDEGFRAAHGIARPVRERSSLPAGWKNFFRFFSGGHDRLADGGRYMDRGVLTETFVS